MPQEPGATIRIDGELYRELRAIADARDCTLRQSMDYWIDRLIKERESANSKRIPKRAKRTKPKGSKPRAKPEGAILADGKFHKLLEGTSDIYEDEPYKP